MTIKQCLPYINNELKFCNLLTQDYDKESRKKLAYVLRMRDLEIAQKEKRHKICPHCYMQMPLTDICDLCGYKA